LTSVTKGTILPTVTTSTAGRERGGRRRKITKTIIRVWVCSSFQL